jgi:hypothetical protein
MHGSSTDSNAQVNQFFFDPIQPVFNASQTWKSEQAREREQFERKKNLIKHIAPEQFRDAAKPTNKPCEIVPRNYNEWVQHQADVKRMEIEEMNKTIKIKEDRKNAGSHARLPIKSAFGINGKQLKAKNLSTVLAQPTVFTPFYEATDIRPQAQWPCHAELHWDGDSRENCNAKTRCGRFLPALRDPRDENVMYSERRQLAQLPLDQTAITNHLYGFGPPPRVFIEANMIMDKDPRFESAGQFYLGADLMQEIGEWKEPHIPDWLMEQKAQHMVHAHPMQMILSHSTPAIQTHPSLRSDRLQSFGTPLSIDCA